MTVTSVHIYYPSAITPVTGVLVPQTTSAFDLRQLINWSDSTAVGATTTVQVCFDRNGTVRMTWPKDEFEAAEQASANA